MTKPWPHPSVWHERGKRLMDLSLTIPLLCLFGPLLLLIALGVRSQLGRPVLYRQQRPGRNGQLFTILKFRTMRDAYAADDGQPLPDGERLTPYGAFLRRYSLDELPELINVLKGEMSLVGPRPLLAEYLGCYSPAEERRHQVRPGITGWAQIHGRNQLPWNERLALDVWYVDHPSLTLDLQILWRTIRQVLHHEGVAVDPDTVETNLREERTRSPGTLATATPPDRLPLSNP